MTAQKFDSNRINNTAKIAARLVITQREFYGRPLTDKEIDATSVMAEEIAVMLPENVQISDVHRSDVEEIIAYIDFKAQIPADGTIWHRLKWWWKTSSLEYRIRVIINWLLITAAIILLIIAYGGQLL